MRWQVSDSHAVAQGAVADAHHEHPAYQRHHFETVAQQFDATNFAMWLFLLTEVMFFGGLFTAYLIYRNWYYPAFVQASHQLNIFWGTANTAVLISSSFTMAMAVWGESRHYKWHKILSRHWLKTGRDCGIVHPEEMHDPKFKATE